jgi:hypothetical protein
MKPLLSVALIFIFGFALLAAPPQEKSPKPQYDAKENPLRAADYRDWEAKPIYYQSFASGSPNAQTMREDSYLSRNGLHVLFGSQRGPWLGETTIR